MNHLHGKAATLFLVSLMSAASLGVGAGAASAADATPNALAAESAASPALSTALAAVSSAAKSPLSPLAADVRAQLGSNSKVIEADGGVPVEISVSPGRLQNAAQSLRKLGLVDLELVSDGPLPSIRTTATAQQLAAIAAVSGVRRVAPANWGQSTDVGAVDSQGDAVVKGPEARATTEAQPVSANGAGVYVGVISDSFNRKTVQVDDPDNPGKKKAVPGLEAAQGSGDLPATVNILNEGPANGTDEGQAMAQIIYDEAPGITQMAFSSTSNGGKAAAINRLRNAGVKVIADDIYSITDPVYQDGASAIAAKNAISAGVVYVASAGNRGGNSAFETAPAFVADPNKPEKDPAHPVNPELEDFGNGVTTKKIATVPDGGSAYYDLQWKEAWGAAQSDLGLRLVNAKGVPLATTSVSDDNNVTSGIPQEGAGYANNTGRPVDVYAQITHKRGTPVPALLRLRSNKDFVAGFGNAITVNAGVSSVSGVIAAAASDWSTPTVPESFSSRGPVTHYFDQDGAALANPEVINKPDVMAPDGVATTVSGFSAFYGTSAAAPATAGAIALALTAYPTATPEQIKTWITSGNATTPADAGYAASRVGSGLIQADLLVGLARAQAAADAEAALAAAEQ